jgi:hypothetical protein
MAVKARQVPLFRPPAISIHDDSNVAGKLLFFQLHQVCFQN